MTVSSDAGLIIRNHLLKWYSTIDQEVVPLIIHENEEWHVGDDYVLALRMVFLPVSLEYASMEVWITPDGAAGIGIETWPRIGERVRSSARAGPFGVGFEPHFLPSDELVDYCQAVANAEFTMWAWVLCGRLIDTAVRLDMSSGLFPWERGISSGLPRPLISWLPGGRRETLRFKPWPRKTLET